MKAWDEIATAALIGTERGAFAAPRCAGAIGEALARVPGETAEARLLGCAAVLDGCGRAGAIPLELKADFPLPAEAETVPECSPKAGQLLLRLLERTEESLGQWREDLIRDWLDLAAMAGRRLPAAALPALLEEGVAASGWRPLLQPLLGRRGTWLAGQNPDWAWALEGGEDSNTSLAVWEEGTAAERKAWLRRMRGKDPKPARERLEAAWKQEPAQARTALLEQFEKGLSLDDEPLLEAALDDRSKEVRRVAAELLARLPESRFAQRMAERAGALIQFSRGLLGGVKIKVELPPEEPEAAWKRDGLEKEIGGAPGDLGKRALLLNKLVSAAPLECWTEWAKATPEELIELARKTEWAEAIVGGWAEAARRQKHGAWCRALLEKVRAKKPEYTETEVLKGLEADERNQFVSRRIQVLKPIDRITPLYRYLAALDLDLDPELTRAVLDGLREALTSKSSYDYYKAEVLMAVADRGAPALYPAAEAMAREVMEQKSEWRNTLQKFLALYEFRHAMHKELKP